MLGKLPPREREIVNLLYAHREATATELCGLLQGNPGNSAVRAMLRRLEAKGFVRHRAVGKGFVYMPALPETSARHSALRDVVRTFFGNSPVDAASALVGMAERLDRHDVERLEALIAKAKEDLEDEQ